MKSIEALPSPFLLITTHEQLRKRILQVRGSESARGIITSLVIPNLQEFLDELSREGKKVDTGVTVHEPYGVANFSMSWETGETIEQIAVVAVGTTRELFVTGEAVEALGKSAYDSIVALPDALRRAKERPRIFKKHHVKNTPDA